MGEEEENRAQMEFKNIIIMHREESSRTDYHGRPVNGTKTLFNPLTDIGLLWSHTESFVHNFLEALLSLTARHLSVCVCPPVERCVGSFSLARTVSLSVFVLKSSHGPLFDCIYPQCFALSCSLCLPS